jgi:hypothetical protein
MIEAWKNTFIQASEMQLENKILLKPQYVPKKQQQQNKLVLYTMCGIVVLT